MQPVPTKQPRRLLPGGLITWRVSPGLTVRGSSDPFPSGVKISDMFYDLSSHTQAFWSFASRQRIGGYEFINHRVTKDTLCRACEMSHDRINFASTELPKQCCAHRKRLTTGSLIIDHSNNPPFDLLKPLPLTMLASPCTLRCLLMTATPTPSSCA